MADLDEVARLGITTAHQSVAATLVTLLEFRGLVIVPVTHFQRVPKSALLDLARKENTGLWVDDVHGGVGLVDGLTPKWYCKGCAEYRCSCTPRAKFLAMATNPTEPSEKTEQPEPPKKTETLRTTNISSPRTSRVLTCKYCGHTDRLNMTAAEFKEFYEHWQDKHQDCTIEYRKRKTA